MADTFLDENIDELLALDPETEGLLTEDIDAEAILGEETILDKGQEQKTETPNLTSNSRLKPNPSETEANQEVSSTADKPSGFDNAEEAEQLDYEEEEEVEEKKQPRESKFISERASSQKSDKEAAQDSHYNNRKHSYNKNGQEGTRCYINPNFKGNLPPTIKVNLTKGPYVPNAPQNKYNAVPSIFMTHIRPAFGGVQQGIGGFGNAFQQNSARFGGHQQPSSSFLPNGEVPINTLPTIHIRPMMQQQHPSSFVPPLIGHRPSGLPVGQGVMNVPRALPHVTSEAVNWSLMVDAFVKKTNSEAMKNDRRRREYSPKSSRSRSPASYSGSSSSASRSPTPVQSRKPRKVSRYDQRDSRSFNNRRGQRQNLASRSRERESKTKPDKHTIECAEAIGLDEEYLKKIEQQKQAREEVARRKNQRRQEDYPGKDSAAPDNLRNSKEGLSKSNATVNNRSNERRRGTSPNQNRNNRRRSPARPEKSGRKEEKRFKTSVEKAQGVSPDLEMKSQTAGKLKAYLAVVVNNVSALENAFKRVSLLANGVGKTKKVWQASEKSVSVIFDKHEDAKAFMLQYHGKSVNGQRMDVTLEKVFLNLSSMP